MKNIYIWKHDLKKKLFHSEPRMVEVLTDSGLVVEDAKFKTCRQWALYKLVKVKPRKKRK